MVSKHSLLPRARVAFVVLLLVVAATSARAQQPLSSAFTYQGKLSQSGSPVTASVGMRFLLYDSATGSNTVGAVILNPVQIQEGVFTVELDFGVAAFNGQDRWLEVIVDGQTLGPRQRIAATPYSLQTRGLYVDDQRRVGIGTFAPAYPVDVLSTQAVLRLESILSSNGSVLELRGDSFLGNPPTFLGAINFNNSAQTYPGQIAYANSGELRFRVGGLQAVKMTPTSLEATGTGQFRENATLRSINTQPTAGMAGYFENNSTWATTHMQNDGSGEVLWLHQGGSGNYIVATNGSDWKFWVDNAGVTHTKVLEILGGSDLSERFDVVTAPPAPGVAIAPEESVEPGTVVCIDSSSEGKLTISGQPYDRRVAGIISGAGGVRPGMLMGQDGTAASGEHPVALTGRVYCRASAVNGPIQPGDLLTTSAVRGHAMRVDDPVRAQGAILGKAMGSLAQGEGLVLVLVGLQ
jgi:hypothetical protein